MMKATILVLCAFVAVGFAESSLGLDEDSSRPILDVDDLSAPIHYRVQRSPEPQGSLSATYLKPLDGPERRPSYNFDYNNRLVNRKDGSIDLSVGAQKLPGSRVEPTVGLSGTFRFRRSPEPQGSLSATYLKPLDGPERRPSYNFDYNNRLVNRKDGSIDLSVGAQKLPGSRVEPTVGLSGTFRFRRSPEPQGSLSATYLKPLDGPERRPSYNFDYNNRLVNRKDGSIDLSVGAQKLPGSRVEPTVGLSGTFRFRRSPEPQGSLSATYLKPLDGPERRPSYNFDYNNRLVNRKDGSIDLSVGAQKLPGSRVEPTVGLSGTFRFRRSPEPQGSLSATYLKPLDGPERRPSYNFDYNNRLVNRKDGSIDLSVGAQKLPGSRVEPTVGLSGTFRFRRSPEPQGSLSATYLKPLDGPERRPSYNFDYNNRLVNRKDGSIDLSVGAQKLPGSRVEPTVGLSGTFRFRRSPEPQGSLSATYLKPLDGPERRPSYNFDYNNRLVNRKDGSIDLSVGAQKLPGSRVEPTVGLSGTFRFRRSSDSEN